MYTKQNLREEQDFLIGAVNVTSRMDDEELYQSDAIARLSDYAQGYAENYPTVTAERIRRYSARALRMERGRRRATKERLQAGLVGGIGG